MAGLDACSVMPRTRGDSSDVPMAVLASEDLSQYFLKSRTNMYVDYERTSEIRRFCPMARVSALASVGLVQQLIGQPTTGGFSKVPRDVFP